MMNQIQVKFVRELSGYDVFRSTDTYRRNYVRIPGKGGNTVQWGTASVHGDHVEPSEPLADGTIIQVVDSKKQVLFAETMTGELAKTVGQSSAAYELDIARSFMQNHRLLDYEEWRKRLLSYMPENYAGYSDTWLYCDIERIDSELVQPVRRLGQLLYIVRVHYRHKCCPAEWQMYFLSDSEAIDCYAICGYNYI